MEVILRETRLKFVTIKKTLIYEGILTRTADSFGDHHYHLQNLGVFNVGDKITVSITSDPVITPIEGMQLSLFLKNKENTTNPGGVCSNAIDLSSHDFSSEYTFKLQVTEDADMNLALYTEHMYSESVKFYVKVYK